MLAFSRIQHLDLAPVALSVVVRSAFELASRALGPNIAVEFIDKRPQAQVLTDAEQLEFVILNLAINAQEAMPRGGRLVIETTAGHGDAGSAGFACIRVTDNGAGMTEEVLQRATEPFFTTKKHDQATGLGLSQVQNFVEKCRGRMSIRSTPGQGTEVEILLPGAAGNAVVPGPSAPSAETSFSQAQGQEVLLIDDDEEVRFVLRELLVGMGFVVSEATCGREALARLANSTPAVALIDFLMPEMNGDEVARLARVTHQHLPIVFISGYFDTMALAGIPDACVLRKPVTAEALRDAIYRAMAPPSVADAAG
jgi:CheY-like chemotaxis protein